jgi:putative transposase
MDDDFYFDALQSALHKHQTPMRFNTDLGTQYTVKAFTGALKNHGVQISMAVKGRCMDKIFIERLWRSVKYEMIFLEEFETVPESLSGLKDYFEFYNFDRPHESMLKNTPAEIY